MRTFSYGGGVQSTACLVLAVQGRVEYPVFLFANTGDDSESPKTLEYVREVAIPYATRGGVELHTLQRTWQRGARKGKVETLWGRLMRPDSRSLPIPVRMPDTGAPGTRSCTVDFKIRVILRWQKEHGATAESPAICGLGISLDEFQRARSSSGFAEQRLEYPLLDLRLTRDDCRQIIQDAGLPVPPKSACYFCPFHAPSEWARMLREEPELFARSVELERTLNTRRRALGRDAVYLTRFGRPLDEAITDDQLTLSPDAEACGGFCMT